MIHIAALCRAILMTVTRWLPSFPAMEDMIGNAIERLLADAGYRGHNAPTDYKFRVHVDRSAGSHRRSNASCGGAPPSNQ